MLSTFFTQSIMNQEATAIEVGIAGSETVAVSDGDCLDPDPAVQGEMEQAATALREAIEDGIENIVEDRRNKLARLMRQRYGGSMKAGEWLLREDFDKEFDQANTLLEQLRGVGRSTPGETHGFPRGSKPRVGASNSGSQFFPGRK